MTQLCLLYCTVLLDAAETATAVCFGLNNRRPRKCARSHAEESDFARVFQNPTSSNLMYADGVPVVLSLAE